MGKLVQCCGLAILVNLAILSDWLGLWEGLDGATTGQSHQSTWPLWHDRSILNGLPGDLGAKGGTCLCQIRQPC